jgi:uncharacterized protein (TIGR02117 family)
MDIGLERGVALGHHLAPELHDVVERAHWRQVHLLGAAHPVGRAVRPVEADALAHRAAEERVDRHPESAGRHIEESVLDGLPGAGILADQGRGELGDDRGNSGAAEGLVVLAPAHDPLVRADLEEIEVAPSRVGMKRLHPGDLHPISSGRPEREGSGGLRLGYRRPDRLGKRRLALAALGAGLLATACLGPVRELDPARSGEATTTVYVVGHGWHSGIVIRRDQIPSEAWPEHGRFPPAPFLEVGWGDRAFYQSPDAGVGPALRAAFASGGSVLHVAGLGRPPAELFTRAEVVAVELSGRGVEALARFVSRAYTRDLSGDPIDLGPGLYPGSRFYAATGRYSLLYTCNSWIAEALRAGGCPITPAWALTAGNLLFQAARCR